MTEQFGNSPRQLSCTMEVRKKPAQKQYIVGDYKIGKKIGTGAYGCAYLAYKISTGEKLAVKIIPFDESNYESVKYEARISQQLLHDNIVRIEEVIEQKNKIYIFMEYCEKGELFEYVKTNGPLSQELAGKIFVQIHSAVKYLHQKKIAHRDIKTENILLDAHMNPKLIDFGLAKEYDDLNMMMQTFCGSPSYVAPQILKKQKYTGQKVDVWSLGVTLYIMLEAAEPFYSKSKAESKIKISNHKWIDPLHSSRQAIQMYEKIFVAAANRLSLPEIQNCTFFEKYSGKRRRFQSRSTQKTERLSTGQGVQFILPQIINPQRRKQNRSSLRKYLQEDNAELKPHQFLYNSILYGQMRQKFDQRRKSTDLKNLKEDFRIKMTPTKNIKRFPETPTPTLGLLKKEFIYNIQY